MGSRNQVQLRSKLLEKFKEFFQNSSNIMVSTFLFKVTKQGGLEVPHSDENLNLKVEALLVLSFYISYRSNNSIPIHIYF